MRSDRRDSFNALPFERSQWRATRVEIITELLTPDCWVLKHRFRRPVDKSLKSIEHTEAKGVACLLRPETPKMFRPLRIRP
jgi:hypothetical protein